METILDVLTIGGAAYVAYRAMNAEKAVPKGLKPLVKSIMLSAIVLGVAELLDILQVFADGTMMSQLVYEKELIVIAILFWGLSKVKK